MGNKPNQPHPKRLGKSAAEVAAEQRAQRAAENERIAAEQERIEADDFPDQDGRP